MAGTSMLKSNQEIISVITSPSTLLRHEPATGETFRSPEPYNRIVALTLGSEALTLTFPDYQESDDYAVRDIQLPSILRRRFFDYASQLLDMDGHRRLGNCHDFTSYMLGYNALKRVEATYVMNAQVPNADVFSNDTMSIQAGQGLLVGHPEHVLEAPASVPYAWEYSPPPVGFGPLRMIHSGLSIGENDGEQLVLQRIALKGPLSLDPLTHFVRAQSAIPAKIPDDHWRDGKRPAPEDLRLMRVAKLGSTPDFYAS